MGSTQGLSYHMSIILYAKEGFKASYYNQLCHHVNGYGIRKIEFETWKITGISVVFLEHIRNSTPYRLYAIDRPEDLLSNFESWDNPPPNNNDHNENYMMGLRLWFLNSKLSLIHLIISIDRAILCLNKVELQTILISKFFWL